MIDFEVNLFIYFINYITIYIIKFLICIKFFI